MMGGQSEMRVMVWVLVVAFILSPFAGAASYGLSRPFALPVAAKSTETSKDGKGWLESGIMRVSFVQTEASFKAAMAQCGWKYRHAVALGKGNTHTLYTWNRGGNELTLMLRRIDVNKTSFSWGLAKTEKQKKGKL